MKLAHKLNLLRVALPIVSFSIAMYMGHGVLKSLWVMVASGLLSCFLAALSFLTLGGFLPIMSLYGLKIADKKEKLIDFTKPENRLWLYLSCVAYIVVAVLFSRSFLA